VACAEICPRFLQDGNFAIKGSLSKSKQKQTDQNPPEKFTKNSTAPDLTDAISFPRANLVIHTVLAPSKLGKAD